MQDDQETLEKAADLADACGEHQLAEQIRGFAARLAECAHEGKAYRP